MGALLCPSCGELVEPDDGEDTPDEYAAEPCGECEDIP